LSAPVGPSGAFDRSGSYRTTGTTDGTPSVHKQASVELNAERTAAGFKPAGRSGSALRNSLGDYLWMLVFLGPNLTLFIVFVAVPIAGAVSLSLFQWDLTSTPRFVGLDNFYKISSDPQVFNSLLRTLTLLVGAVMPTVIGSFLIAVLINVQFIGYRIIRTLYFMPVIISFVASALLWTWIFNPRSGPINVVLRLIGIDGPDWIGNPATAIWSVVIVLVWMRLPIGILLYLAALQNVNQSLLEAARIDGASSLDILRHVLWPAVRPVTLFVTITTTQSVLFESFDVVNVMTNGGPLYSTNILIKHIYETAFHQFDFGYASAMATILFLIVVLIAAVLFPLTRSKT
jgi:ABC-type sugar transport system permease subunit